MSWEKRFFRCPGRKAGTGERKEKPTSLYLEERCSRHYYDLATEGRGGENEKEGRRREKVA